MTNRNTIHLRVSSFQIDRDVAAKDLTECSRIGFTERDGSSFARVAIGGMSRGSAESGVFLKKVGIDKLVGEVGILTRSGLLSEFSNIHASLFLISF